VRAREERRLDRGRGTAHDCYGPPPQRASKRVPSLVLPSPRFRHLPFSLPSTTRIGRPVPARPFPVCPWMRRSRPRVRAGGGGSGSTSATGRDQPARRRERRTRGEFEFLARSRSALLPCPLPGALRCSRAALSGAGARTVRSSRGIGEPKARAFRRSSSGRCAAVCCWVPPDGPGVPVT
jgi:hypothetical protein